MKGTQSCLWHRITVTATGRVHCKVAPGMFQCKYSSCPLWSFPLVPRMDPWKALHDTKKELWYHWNERDRLPKGVISLKATYYWCSGCILQVSGTGLDSGDHPGATWYPPPRLLGVANHVVQTNGTLSKCNLPPLWHGKQCSWDRIIVLSRWNWALGPRSFKHCTSVVIAMFSKMLQPWQRRWHFDK